MAVNLFGLYRLCVLFAILNAGSSRLLGAIRPSFWPDYSAWHATNIVAARTTAEDGVFKVDESWKGDVRPGELVFVPELKPSRDGVPISSFPKMTMTPFGDTAGPNLQMPRQPPASLMILFLKRADRSKALRAAQERDPAREWDPASSFDDFKSAVVWIEGGQVYGFQQWLNPGPSILTRLETSVPKLRERVVEVIRIQRDVEDTLAIQDGNARAMRLKPHVHSNAVPAKLIALSELGRCGPSAVPTIRGMLDDAAFSDEAPEIVKAYAAAGGETVGADLNARLRDELNFWGAAGRSLRPGWWNQIPAATALRNHYSVTVELVRVLQQIRYRDALLTARELREFWRSLPQLNDPSGLNQMIEECDRLIKHLQSN